jgi:hypothetical protein
MNGQPPFSGFVPRFPRIAFAFAGIYGLVAMIPQYWLEQKISRDSPPAITHPEYFYGFIGVVIAWQLVFLLIARDPLRLRPIMPVAIVEKLAFAIPVIVLYSQQRASRSVLGFGLFDLVLGALFLASYVMTDPRRANTANRSR